MDQLYAALQRAALFEATGQRAAIQQYLDEMERETDEKRQALIKKLTVLLNEEKAKPDPIPEVVAAYTKVLARLEDPST